MSIILVNTFSEYIFTERIENQCSSVNKLD